MKSVDLAGDGDSSISSSYPIHQTTHTTTITNPPPPHSHPYQYPPLDPEQLKHTQPQTRIFLRPLAAPSCLGFAMFFASTFVLSTYLASWWGSPLSPFTFWPFLLTTGAGQFVAGLYGFPARDHLATVVHVTWGAFFLAYAILQWVTSLGLIPAVDKFAPNSEVAIWFVVLATITWCCFLATIGRDFVIGVTTFLLALGSTLTFAGYFGSDPDNVRRTIKAGAYVLMLASLAALYRVLRYLIEEGFVDENPTWWPVIKSEWEHRRGPVRVPVNEPGIRKGQ